MKIVVVAFGLRNKMRAYFLAPDFQKKNREVIATSLNSFFIHLFHHVLAITTISPIVKFFNLFPLRKMAWSCPQGYRPNLID